MKKLYKILFFSATMFAGNAAFGQTENFIIYDFDSLSGCTNNLQVGMSIGNNPETGGIITVNWGDGNTETLNYTTAAGVQDHWEDFDHGYAVAGLYNATVSIFSTTAGANVGTAQTIQLLANDPANCGVLSLHTVYNTPNTPLYFSDAAYDFEGNDGTVTTITPSSNFGDDYSGLNLANIPYTVTVNQQWLDDHGLEVVSPASHTLASFDVNGVANINHATTAVTCSATSTIGADFTISYAYGIFVAPLQTGTINVFVCNNNCSGNSSSATVSLTFDPAITPITTGLNNPVVTGNVLTFDVMDLTYCLGFPIEFTFPGNTPAGTELAFTATVTSTTTEVNTSNNTATFTATVVNSYDPNNKLVNKAAIIDPNAQEVLQYTINFQNEGNYPALDVVVTDPISENLDLSTFRLLGSKHGVAASVNEATRVVTFSFNNIMLAPKATNEEGSKGYVVYSIEENAGLPLNSVIENTAYIYFDFNPAVVTNTTKNTNAVLSVDETSMANISMYPNPANSSVHFNGAAVKSIQVIDVSGKIVLNAETVSANEISVAGLANGIYQIVIATETGMQTQKLVIRK